MASNSAEGKGGRLTRSWSFSTTRGSLLELPTRIQLAQNVNSRTGGEKLILMTMAEDLAGMLNAPINSLKMAAGDSIRSGNCFGKNQTSRRIKDEEYTRFKDDHDLRVTASLSLKLRSFRKSQTAFR